MNIRFVLIILFVYSRSVFAEPTISQSIDFAVIPNKTYGDASFTLGATASSGLGVSYISSNESVATVLGNTLSIVGVGTTIITASQAGDDNYLAAPDSVQSLTVNKANQIVNFEEISSRKIGDLPFNLNASATSGLPIVYTSSNTSVATVTNGQVLIKAIGTTIISASQSGDKNYNMADIVDRLLIVEDTWVEFTYTNGCLGDEFVFNHISEPPSGSTVMSRTWDFGNGITSSEESPSILFSSDSAHLVKLTVTTNASVSTRSQIVFVKPIPNVNFYSDTVCAGMPTKLINNSVNNSLQIQNWQWDFGDGTPIVDVRHPNSHLYAFSGSFTVSLKAIAKNGCSNFLESNILVNSVPQKPTFTYNKSIICDSDSSRLTLTQAPGVSYRWKYNGVEMTVETDTFYAKQNGLYKSIAIQNNCRSESDTSLNLIVNARPNLPLLEYGNTSVCGGGFVNISTPKDSGISYQWFDGGKLLSAETGNVLIAVKSGNYSVRATNSKNCRSQSMPVDVMVNAKPVIPVISVKGDTVLCNGDSSKLEIVKNAGESYQWYLDNNEIMNANSNIFEAKKQGRYKVQANNQFGCFSVSAEKMLRVNPRPEIPNVRFQKDTICMGDSLSVSVDSIAGIDYRWSVNDTLLSVSNKFDFMIGTGGIYLLKLKNEYACESASIARKIVVNPVPTNPDLKWVGNTEFCTGDSLEASYKPAGNVTYHWLKNNQVLDNVTGVKWFIKTSGNYKVLATNKFGCQSSSKSVEVISNLLPNKEFMEYSSTSFCKGDSLMLYIDKKPNTKYLWRKDKTIVPNNESNILYVKSSGLYFVQLTNLYECKSYSDTLKIETVTKPPIPKLLTTNNETSYCQGADFSISVANASTLYQYKWYFNGSMLNDETSSSISGNLNEGEYKTEVYSGGCSVISSNLILTYKPQPIKPEIKAVGPKLWVLSSLNNTYTNYQWYLNGQEITGANKNVYIAGQNLGQYQLRVNNGSECWSSSDLLKIPELIYITGFETEEPVKLIDVIPNPSKGYFQVHFPSNSALPIRIDILTSNGITVYRGMFLKTPTNAFFEYTIHQPGYYIIQIVEGEKKYFKAIIVN